MNTLNLTDQREKRERQAALKVMDGASIEYNVKNETRDRYVFSCEAQEYCQFDAI